MELLLKIKYNSNVGRVSESLGLLSCLGRRLNYRIKKIELEGKHVNARRGFRQAKNRKIERKN
jgi:hypothetical protein